MGQREVEISLSSLAAILTHRGIVIDFSINRKSSSLTRFCIGTASATRVTGMLNQSDCSDSQKSTTPLPIPLCLLPLHLRPCPNTASGITQVRAGGQRGRRLHLAHGRSRRTSPTDRRRSLHNRQISRSPDCLSAPQAARRKKRIVSVAKMNWRARLNRSVAIKRTPVKIPQRMR